MARKHLILFAVVFVLGISLTAVSAQARETTARRPGETMADILGLLDRERPDQAKLDRFRTAAEASPPAGTSEIDLVKFYIERGNAASALGRTRQHLADIREAARLGRAHPDQTDLIDGLKDLAFAENMSGHRREAFAARMEQLKEQERIGKERRGRMFSAMATVVVISAQAGEMEFAHQWLDRLKALLTESQEWRRGQAFAEFGYLWKMFVAQAEAAVFEAEGFYAKGEEARRRVVAAAEEELGSRRDKPETQTSAQWHLDNALINLARVLALQGKLVEAETTALRALAGELRRYGRYAPQTGDMLRALTGIVTEQGRLTEALPLARATIDIYQKVGHGPESVSAALARVNLATVQLLSGRMDEAEATFSALARDLGPYPDLLRRMLGANPRYAYALIKRGRAAEAREICARAVADRRRIYGDSHAETARALGLEAVARAATGDRGGALTGFAQAVPVLIDESLATSADGGGVPAIRELFNKTIFDSAIGLLMEAGRQEDAFRFAEAARGRSVQTAIAASAVRSAASTPELAEMVRAEQDSEFTLAALRGVLADQMALAAAEQDRDVISRLTRDIERAEDNRKSSHGRIERRFPAFAELSHPHPATQAQALAALRPEEALISIMVGAERSYVWALRPGQAPVSAVVPLGAVALARMVADLRRGLDVTSGTIPAFDSAAAYRLFSALLAPVANGWRGATSLLVVPDKALGALPFALLPTKPPAGPSAGGSAGGGDYRQVAWLVRDMAVTQLPSATSLAALRKLPAPSSGRKPFLGFGDPWFNREQAQEGRADATRMASATAATTARNATIRAPAHFRARPRSSLAVDLSNLGRMLPRLPETADEVRSVATLLGADPGRDVILGIDATVERVKSSPLNDRRVVMFATHGLMAGEVAGLAQPALALTMPEVSGGRGSGLLMLDDILGLHLDADLVVLSACNTAAGDGGEANGAESVSGLGRAFFHAGSRALLVTHWAVETTSAAALTTGFFGRLGKSGSRAQALREAMVAVMDQGETPFGANGYAHPLFWSAYALVGEPTGTGK
ncbi:putative Tetratricopeptide TPR_2 repeat protein [uncultured Gammaproteobacteria bacterium]